MRRVLLATVFCLAPSAYASAQDAPRLDLFGGYSALAGDETAHGFELSLGFATWGRLGLVADVSRHAKDSVVTEAFLAGPRLTFGAGGLRPSFHALLGVVRSGASIEIFDVSISERETDLAAAVGGALDVGAARRLSLRVKADYLLVKAAGETTGDPRLSGGVVFRF